MSDRTCELCGVPYRGELLGGVTCENPDCDAPERTLSDRITGGEWCRHADHVQGLCDCAEVGGLVAALEQHIVVKQDIVDEAFKKIAALEQELEACREGAALWCRDAERLLDAVRENTKRHMAAVDIAAGVPSEWVAIPGEAFDRLRALGAQERPSSEHDHELMREHFTGGRLNESDD